MFRVGMKVVCVDDSALSCGPCSPAMIYGLEVIKGRVYEVRWVGRYQIRYLGNPWGDPYHGIRVVGIVRPGMLDTPFDSRRFRPLVERKTSIEIFQRMLRTTKEPAHV